MLRLIKFGALTLCLALITLFLFSCFEKDGNSMPSGENSSGGNSGDASSDGNSGSSSSDGNSGNNSGDASSDQPADDKSYEDIERYDPDGYEIKYLGIENSKYFIELTCPNSWTFSKNPDGSASIIRNDITVGTVIKGKASDTSSWKIIETDSHSGIEVTSEMYFERSLDNADTYRVRYEYSYKESSSTQLVTLLCNYSELSDFSQSRLLRQSTLNDTSFDIGIGVLSDLSDASSIAIFGNSFIGSSNIGSILMDMFMQNGKHISVTAIPTGNATVNTYTSDSGIMSKIRNGVYDAVFICGFYNPNEVENLGILKSACDQSSTRLIIFPAHNEDANVIKSACARYPELTVLNWKNELDMLIARGVDRWQLCDNDYYKHSTAIAGYVGAHMIYRAIYGAMPTGYYQSNVNSVLGNYSTTGEATKIQSSQVTYVS